MIINCSWIKTIRKVRNVWKKLLKKVFGLQTMGYHGAPMVVKNDYLFNRTFIEFHTGCQNGPKSESESNIKRSTKVYRFFSLKIIISLREGFLLIFSDNFDFWYTLFFKRKPHFWRCICESQIKKIHLLLYVQKSPQLRLYYSTQSYETIYIVT